MTGRSRNVAPFCFATTNREALEAMETSRSECLMELKEFKKSEMCS